MQQRHFVNSQQGYIALLTVLIVSAIVASITTSVLLVSTQTARITTTKYDSAKAIQLAHSCAEEALQQINDSTPYSGSGNLIIDGARCEYLVTRDGGQRRTIISTGVSGNVSRKVTILVTRVNPSIEYTSWLEVADH